MTRLATPCMVVALAGLLTACASPKICTREIRKSEPAAVALLRDSQRADGRAAFTNVHDLSVRYEGRWASIGPRFQPVLSDTGFRRGSEERLIIEPRIMAQEHTGPAGKKLVVRVPGKVSVAYNGALSTDAETKRAAALVADAYTLFLSDRSTSTGPASRSPPMARRSWTRRSAIRSPSCDRGSERLRRRAEA